MKQIDPNDELNELPDAEIDDQGRDLNEKQYLADLIGGGEQ